MELSKILPVVVIVVVALVLILFPEARALLKGFTRLFIKDMAQTPDGAEAIYTEKIDQVQDSYSRAENALRIASGKLSNAKRDMAAKKERLKRLKPTAKIWLSQERSKRRKSSRMSERRLSLILSA